METTFKDRAPGRKLAFALTIILLLFSASCGSDGGSSDAAGGGGGGGTVTDTTAPTLASSVPADNATGIAVNANVTLTFSETMTGVSVTTDTTCTGSVQLSKDNFTTCVAGVLSSSDNITYEFNPSADLDASTIHKVKILADAKDAAGNAIAETTTSFTTEAGADTTAPTFAGATGATADSSSAITISWSAASDDTTAQGSIVYDIYQATTSGGQNYTAATATSAAGATSHQITGLAASTAYYFVVRARDAAGNRDTNTTEVNATTSAGGAPLSAGDLVISEVMANPSTATDSNGEYIEIYNTSGSLIDFSVNNITIDDGGAPQSITSGTITANGYFLLCHDTNSGNNGGISNCNATLSVAMTNGGETLTVKENSTTIDAFTFNADAGDGFAWELKPDKMTSSDNDDFANNWRKPLFPYGGSGTDDWGTPGTSNSKPILISEVMQDGGAADDEFIEIYNPNDVAIHLGDAGYRIERKTNTTGDPDPVCDFQTAAHFKNSTLPANLTIPAHGFYLLANENYTSISVTPDAWVIDGSGHMIITTDNTIYIGKGAISGKTDVDILDFVGFGTAADYDGSGTAPVLSTDGHSIERKAYSNSTADSNAATGMFSGGGHEAKGNSYDTNDNANDFILRTTANPQNSSSALENP